MLAQDAAQGDDHLNEGWRLGAVIGRDAIKDEARAS
jgi:hypothetical protein